MTPKLTVLDESKQTRHGILAVGGIVLDHQETSEIERRWREEKMRLGLGAETPIRYAMTWIDLDDRRRLIELIGDLPVQGIVALLEDFRPAGMKLRKATRRDIYIFKLAFRYVLQRLVEDLYVPAGGPHLVAVDDRDDLDEFRAEYERRSREEQTFASGRTLPPLRSRGFSDSLMVCSSGPMHEIADMLTSVMTRWADCRCKDHKGGKTGNIAELDACVAAVIDRFPVAPYKIRPRRQGYSLITHTQNKTGKELLRDNIDRWIEELQSVAEPVGAEDDIPF